MNSVREGLRAPDIGMRRANNDDTLQPLAVPCGYPPSDNAAPTVADQTKTTGAVGIGQRYNVHGENIELVCRDLLRSLAFVIAAHVRNNDMVTLIRQRSDLMAPGPPKLGKAVEKDEQGSVPRTSLDHMEHDAVHPSRRVSPAGLFQVECAHAG
ncbi:hypothetical protein Sa4125_18160 [Aureimonas sp. SA4125]|uniref:hypothetical protein n=1 Tax=Aureimonas sp. SA4125 TaxID=2826993 RepID=UPI001E39C74F|nr:hypothetical protein [Aureimonas sp. SA4125]BDA84274.1 hypothetical protein Sa4125_18160 [Aureimonas sp. SA4125]